MGSREAGTRGGNPVGSKRRRESPLDVSLLDQPGEVYGSRSGSASCRRMHPLNFSIGSHLAFTKYEEGHFPEAIEEAAATLRLDPAHQPSSFYQIRAYEESGQLSEAIAIRRRIGWNDPPVDALETGLRRDGAAGYWRLCKEFWFREERGGPARPSEIAWIYAHLG